MTCKELLAISLMLLLTAGGVHVARCRMLCGFGKVETLPLRGMLALWVMLGHIDSHVSPHLPVLHSMRWMTAAVAGFFFLSGYGLYKSLEMARQRGLEDEYFLKFPYRSLVRLYVPYLFFFLLWEVVSSLMKTPWVGPVPQTFVYGFLPMPGGWYVKALTVLYAVFWVSFRFIKNRWALPGVVLGVLGYWLNYRGVPGIPRNAYATIFLFPIGMAVAVYEKTIRAFVLKVPILVYFGTAALLLAVASYRRLGIPWLGLEPYYILIGISFWLCCSAADILAKCRFLIWTGSLSYEIYLIHGILIQAVLAWGLNRWGILLITVLTTYTASYLLARVFAAASKKLLTGFR